MSNRTFFILVFTALILAIGLHFYFKKRTAIKYGGYVSEPSVSELAFQTVELESVFTETTAPTFSPDVINNFYGVTIENFSGEGGFIDSESEQIESTNF